MTRFRLSTATRTTSRTQIRLHKDKRKKNASTVKFEKWWLNFRKKLEWWHFSFESHWLFSFSFTNWRGGAHSMLCYVTLLKSTVVLWWDHSFTANDDDDDNNDENIWSSYFEVSSVHVHIFVYSILMQKRSCHFIHIWKHSNSQEYRNEYMIIRMRMFI